MILATRNARDFSKVPAWRIQDWTIYGYLTPRFGFRLYDPRGRGVTPRPKDLP